MRRKHRAHVSNLQAPSSPRDLRTRWHTPKSRDRLPSENLERRSHSLPAIPFRIPYIRRCRTHIIRTKMKKPLLPMAVHIIINLRLRRLQRSSARSLLTARTAMIPRRPSHQESLRIMGIHLPCIGMDHTAAAWAAPLSTPTQPSSSQELARLFTILMQSATASPCVCHPSRAPSVDTAMRILRSPNSTPLAASNPSAHHFPQRVPSYHREEQSAIPAVTAAAAAATRPSRPRVMPHAIPKFIHRRRASGAPLLDARRSSRAPIT